MSQIEKALDKINRSSLAKIHFFNEPIHTIVEKFDFYNIIFAADGQYVAINNDFGYAIDKVESIKYTNSCLGTLEGMTGIYLRVPKPNLELFVKIIEIFKYVYDKIKSEICVNVYFNKNTRKFHINIEDQLVNGTNADYTYDEQFEMSKGYIRYLQIHSHHTMGANFSGKDDNDEKLTALCYYGVVGKLNGQSSFYNIETKFRVWNGSRFVEVAFGDVFNLGIAKPDLTDKDLLKLTCIINRAEEEKNKKAMPLLPIGVSIADITKDVNEEALRFPFGGQDSIFGDTFNESSRRM
jgi:PRTRC genetic system protein A